MRRNQPQNTENKGIFRKIRSYLFIGILVILSLSLFRNMSNIRQVEQKIADKEKEVEKIKKEQTELQKKLEFTKGSEYIEKQLRDKLGLVREGEIVVVLPPPEVLRKFAPKHEEEEEVLPDPNWKRWLKLFI